MNPVNLSLPIGVDCFIRLLSKWYGEHKRDLPWRANPDPYWVWLSEIMLQQTRMQAVLPYFKRFVRAFPTLEQLASADEEAVLELWSGLGYYSRARNLHKTARLISSEHGGAFPEDYDEAVKLPGIGPYTASAILSIAFGQTHAVLDGNVRRVLTRYLAIREEVTGPVVAGIKALLSEVAGSVRAVGTVGDFNQALMELGALVCQPREPGCGDCPLRKSCRGVAQNVQHQLPRVRKKRATEEIRETVAVIERGGRYLMRRCGEDTYLKGMWLFPKVEGWPAGEALTTSFSRDHGLAIVPMKTHRTVVHYVTFRRLLFRPVQAVLVGGLPEGIFKWMRLGEGLYPVSSYIYKILDALGRG